MAKKIHEKSKRASGPFTKINCTTIPENLLESELFGYSKGAFTGASAQGKQGLVELSNGGTLFLDEIGELPLNVQSKLLELVQEKTFLPVGGTKLKYVDTRIIAATNKNLMELVKENKFRIDLYYRLSVATINLPPLNELHDDIESLLDFYLKHYNEKHNLNVRFEPKTKEILINYSWPGNIRELEHLIEFLVLTSNNIIITDILPNYILKNSDASNRISYDNCSLDFLLEEEEKKVIQNMFSKYNSSYKLAEKLKISQSKANRLIRKHCNSKEPSQI
jgi:transcriptional regulator with PAS, ATPase and Fis domain